MARKPEIRTTEQARRSVSESAFQEAVIALSRMHGWRVAHFRPVQAYRKDGTARWLTPVQADGAGFPDLCMARNGQVVFAELKRVGGRVTPEQRVWLDALSGAVGAYVWTPDDWDEIEAVLR